MFDVSGWIIGIASVCLFSVVVDLVLPSGKTNALIKRVVSYVIVLVVLLPIPRLIGSNISIGEILHKNEFYIQDNYIYNINQNKLDVITDNIYLGLEEKGILGAVVSVSANIFETDMKIDAIYVDLYNVVITVKNENIDIKTEVISVVQNVVNIEGDKIILYE